MKTAVIATAVVFLTGCQALMPTIETASDKVAEGVDKYCSETDENFRSNFRTLVNSKTGGASIVVTCPD